MMDSIALDITAQDKPGALHAIAEAIANAGTNISRISTGEKRKGKTKMYVELEHLSDSKKLEKELNGLPEVLSIREVPTFGEIFGKRVIVIGGGAQVAEVAKGAISEADRHNIRGEKISIDTIPLVGEDKIEKAIRAVARLSRAEVLVLAGSIMGGNIKEAVEEVQDLGVIVISLNMAGSVPEVCDLVVTDPVQAGVMAVMAIADTAEFDIGKQRGKVF
jgi:energy-converting hydrogenase B subunit Q